MRVSLAAAIAVRRGRLSAVGNGLGISTMARECQRNVESTVRSRARVELGVVRVGDRSDYGESKSLPVLIVRPPRIEPLEGMEEAVDFAGRDERSGVGH